MRVLLVEPAYRRRQPKPPTGPEPSKGKRPEDYSLWYPPLGIMKLSRFHKDRKDDVEFVYGCDPRVISKEPLFDGYWDRVYIRTVFTYDFRRIVETIQFYVEVVGGTISKVYVGGIMASLMADDIFEATGVYPKTGVLHSPQDIGLEGKCDIDLLAPDYDLLDPNIYAINDTYYAYTSRGCTNACPWCGVPKIEPDYVPYIDIKPAIRELRKSYGDKATLKLMDNNALASPELEKIVADLEQLGYGRNHTTETDSPRQRVVDFNQGLDATHLKQKTMKLLARLNIKPMRIAFDRVGEKKSYVRALNLARKQGVQEFSNYMLYNFEDTPRDLYERLIVNIELNEEWMQDTPGRIAGKIYSFPMRYAPINEVNGQHVNRKRDFFRHDPEQRRDWRHNPVWTKLFVRNIEIMRGAAHGAISPTPSLARRTIGADLEEYLANLYMPEELLRNRNKHEKKVYPHEPKRKPGTGKVEEFRKFVLGLLRKQDDRFWAFHLAVSGNAQADVRAALKTVKDKEIRKWLKLYLKQ